MPTADVATILRTRGPEVSKSWRARFIEAYPQAGMMLPPGDAMPPILLRAAASVLEHSPEAVRDELRALAIDLRRTGFPADEYPQAVQLLIDAVGSFLADANADAGNNGSGDFAALRQAGDIMREAASELDYRGVPAATAAQVTSVEDHGLVQVVRLEAGAQVLYFPGQVIPVMSPARPGEWMGLVPALPSNPMGQLEFHIPAGQPVEAGDWLTLGAPRGGVRDDVDRQLLLVAAEGGLAAAKALVFHYLEQPQPPEVHLVVGAREVAGLYDTAALEALAATQSWLDVTFVAESRLEVPLEQVVAGAGMWWARGVIVCADEGRAAGLKAALEAAGARNVQVIAHDAAPAWFSA